MLLGDWIYTKAMQMALAHGQVEVIQRLCDATLRMTEGELLAFQRLGAPDLSIEEYFEIIERKTAHLFAAAVSIPSLIPPQRPEAGQVLSRYGRSLGICFQLVDDLLDFTARESELGKPVLSDLKEGKLTLPLILLLPRVQAGAAAAGRAGAGGPQLRPGLAAGDPGAGARGGDDRGGHRDGRGVRGRAPSAS